MNHDELFQTLKMIDPRVKRVLDRKETPVIDKAAPRSSYDCPGCHPKEKATGNTICPNCAHDFDAHILAVNTYEACLALIKAAREASRHLHCLDVHDCPNLKNKLCASCLSRDALREALRAVDEAEKGGSR